MKTVMTLIICLMVSASAFPQTLQYPADTARVIFKLPAQAFSSYATSANKIEQPIPQNYYSQHLGFFCREELKMQQVHLPVTFRLGNMDYCNHLEQKPGYR